MKQLLTTIGSSVPRSSIRYTIRKPWVFSTCCFFLLLACFALFLSGCQKENLNSGSQRENILSRSQKQESRSGLKKKHAVPFKATFVVTLKTVQQATDVLPELDSVYGTGEGTHIGKSTFTALAVYTPPDFNLTGNAVISVANGDQIFATVQGAPPVIDFTTGNIVLTYQATITGGTGKFSDATGGWTTIAHASIYSTTGTDSLEGTIRY